MKRALINAIKGVGGHLSNDYVVNQLMPQIGTDADKATMKKHLKFEMRRRADKLDGDYAPRVRHNGYSYQVLGVHLNKGTSNSKLTSLSPQTRMRLYDLINAIITYSETETAYHEEMIDLRDILEHMLPDIFLVCHPNGRRSGMPRIYFIKAYGSDPVSFLGRKEGYSGQEYCSWSLSDYAWDQFVHKGEVSRFIARPDGEVVYESIWKTTAFHGVDMKTGSTGWSYPEGMLNIDGKLYCQMPYKWLELELEANKGEVYIEVDYINEDNKHLLGERVNFPAKEVTYISAGHYRDLLGKHYHGMKISLDCMPGRKKTRSLVVDIDDILYTIKDRFSHVTRMEGNMPGMAMAEVLTCVDHSGKEFNVNLSDPRINAIHRVDHSKITDKDPV